MGKIAILLFAVVLVVAVVFLTLPSAPLSGLEIATPPPATANSEENAGKAAAATDAEEARYQALKSEYAKLEKARRNLAIRLRHVDYIIRQAQLPPEQLQSIRADLQNAGRMLHNPPLLGAFNGTDDVHRELERIARMNDRFDAIERQIGGSGSTSGGG
jgi:hypothetical protein